MDYYTITEAAQILGVSVKTLKRWDRNEILVAQRTVTNRRLYTDKQIKEALGEKEKYEDANEILYHVTEAYRRLAKNEEKVKRNNELRLPKVDRENISGHVIFFNFFRSYENLIFDSYDFDFENQFQTIVVSPWNNKNKNILCMIIGCNDCNKEKGINYLQEYMKNNDCQLGIFVYGYNWILLEGENIIKEIDFSREVDISDFKQFLCWM